MSINKRWLTFVLSDDGSFDELIIKTELAFKHKLICIDDEGRYIASADLDEFSIKVIDKVDRLSELLCDEDYTLKITICSEGYFNDEFEEYIKKWHVENKLHWRLDVVMNEDDCKIRRGNTAELFSGLRHIAINILTNDKVFKAGLRRKMRKAAMDRNYLASVLAGSGLS